MVHGETGGELAAPIFADFFKMALKDKPAIPFRLPPDIRQVRVNKHTGQRTDPSDPDAIMEYFKPGTEPAEGYATANGETPGMQPTGWGSSTTSAGGWGATTGAPPAAGGYPPAGAGYPASRAPSAGGLY
jgi:penicillin-binding protein 1A